MELVVLAGDGGLKVERVDLNALGRRGKRVDQCMALACFTAGLGGDVGGWLTEAKAR